MSNIYKYLLDHLNIYILPKKNHDCNTIIDKVSNTMLKIIFNRVIILTFWIALIGAILSIQYNLCIDVGSICKI